MYDAVTLMSLDYEQQIIALLQNINIPDEIALVFDDEVIVIMDNLCENGMLSPDNCKLIMSIENKLSEMVNMDDKSLWTLNALKQAKEWEKWRKDARLLLLSWYQIE